MESSLTNAAALDQLSASSRSRHQLWRLAIVLALLTVVRLIGLKLSDVGLSYDEAQYWSWAQDLEFGYPSKPPLLAWLLAGVHHMCGNEEWCVRSPAPVIYALTCLAIYAVGRQLYDEHAGFWAAILAAFTPGIVFSSRIMSTDVPLLFFFAAALLAYIKILQSSPGLPKMGWGIVLGFCIGFGLLSKYAMIYFVPAMLLASLADARGREAWRETAIWLAGLIAAILVAPNLLWNLQHSFATFQHTGSLVLGEPFQPSLGRALEFLASQLAVMGPVVFSVMMIAAVRFRSRMLTAPDRLMLAFFLTPVAVVTMFAIYSRAFANWAAPSLIPAMVTSTALLLRSRRRVWLWGSVVLGLLIQSTLLVTDTLASRLSNLIGSSKNPYDRVLVWRAAAERAGALAERVGAEVIATDDRRMFNALRYYWRDHSQPIASWDIAGEAPFEFRHTLMPSTAKSILFVTGCPNIERLKHRFSSVEPLSDRPDHRDRRSLQFLAFKLGQIRGQGGSLQPCKSVASLNQDHVSETTP
jgi:4-amino-4-deoxy-L-arabinose transferase-like glycosyltransferase